MAKAAKTTKHSAAGKNAAEDVVVVHGTTVRCDGGGAVTGHPLVFLHIQHDSNEVVCNYCDRRFVLEA